MGDYNTPTLSNSPDVSTEFTNEYSTKGNTSLKATTSSTGGYTGYLLDTTAYSDKTIKLTVDTKTENTTWKLEILYYNSSWSSASSVNIASGETSSNVQIAIPSDATRIQFRLRNVNGSSGDIIYTDNWSLEEV